MPYQCYSECVFLSCCNTYEVYLFYMLFIKLLLTQILKILIVDKLLYWSLDFSRKND